MTTSHASSGGGRRTTTFAGAAVFMSRKLVAPEVFDAVHDALRLNGAEVFPCADPDRTGPLDYHVISSPHVRSSSPLPHPPSLRGATAISPRLPDP